MIVRMWHGKTPESKGDAYLDILKTSGTEGYKNTTGNLGIEILMRTENNERHFLLITYWDSYNSIKKFAGNDIEKAVYYKIDKEYLLEFEENVIHYEVMDKR